MPRTFCSERCRQYTKDVRYFRRCIAEGRFRHPDVQAALQTRLAHLVVGGYAEAARRLPAAVRTEVLAANGGKCCRCDLAPATEVDHINGPSADRRNLQGLCGPCHDAKTQTSYRPMEVEQLQLRDAFIKRVEANPPLRACDDAEAWKSGKAQRREAARAWQWAQLDLIEVSIEDYPDLAGLLEGD
jgi:5-methylcytosine-specific restriction endonuclease McrA